MAKRRISLLSDFREKCSCGGDLELVLEVRQQVGDALVLAQSERCEECGQDYLSVTVEVSE